MADAKVHLALHTSWNGHLAGQLDAGANMAFNFAQLIAHTARTRKVRAGSIVGSGIVADALRGYASIGERRCWEIAEHGEAVTQCMRSGDAVRIEAIDENGTSLMEAVEQKIVRLDR